jgi:hypothetical protein
LSSLFSRILPRSRQGSASANGIPAKTTKPASSAVAERAQNAVALGRESGAGAMTYVGNGTWRLWLPVALLLPFLPQAASMNGCRQGNNGDQRAFLMDLQRHCCLPCETHSNVSRFLRLKPPVPLQTRPYREISHHRVPPRPPITTSFQGQ